MKPIRAVGKPTARMRQTANPRNAGSLGGRVKSKYKQVGKGMGAGVVKLGVKGQSGGIQFREGASGQTTTYFFIPRIYLSQGLPQQQQAMKLINGVIKEAKKRAGVDKILATANAMRPGEVKAYESLGFTPYGTIETLNKRKRRVKVAINFRLDLAQKKPIKGKKP